MSIPSKQRVGVALEQRAVHERARVALVGVADQVLVVARRVAAELPLAPGGKARPAAAAQAGLLDLLDHLLRVHVQRPHKTAVATGRQVVI